MRKLFSLLRAKREARYELLRNIALRNSYAERNLLAGCQAYESYAEAWRMQVSQYDYLVGQQLRDVANTMLWIVLTLAIAAMFIVPVVGMLRIL